MRKRKKNKIKFDIVLKKLIYILKITATNDYC